MHFINKKIVVGILGCLFLLATQASAHFMWLNVHDYTPKADQTAKFTVGWGHAFYNPVGDILCGRETLDGFYLMDPKGKTIEAKPLNEFQYESASSLSRGTYLAIVKRKEGFSTKTAEGYKHQSKKGLKNVISSKYLGMYGKAVINAGEPVDTQAAMQPLDLPFEIIPLADPSTLKAGDYFRFKLLYQGKPVAEDIKATYAGFSYGGAWAYSTRTDKQGIGEVKILESGIWVIYANHKTPYPDPKEADEYSFTTSLTFEVR
jgi:uncharacterized GH25 family protein